jgi:GH15 family glucan-1,4-alpha-glucosidase
MTDLLERSIEIILKYQAPSGAYVASPNFDTYSYSWYRDSTFIAYAMDRVGQTKSSGKFHQWAAASILEREDLILKAIEKGRLGKPLAGDEVLHTRYTLDGQVADEDWPNFQLDGFGTWLWGLAQHQALSGENLSEEWIKAAGLVAEYLAVLWDRPCYDCWEEFEDKIHPHTLAAIFAGLRAYAGMSGDSYDAVLEKIREFVSEQCVVDGYYSKFAGTDLVDSSLLGLAVPYGLTSCDDPRMEKTVEKIERNLLHQGGMQRYARDTYYGGGEWILLTAWYGWFAFKAGRSMVAQEALAWVESRANEHGYLSEQVPLFLNDESYYQPWVDRWGAVANPLLWSHAMYIILRLELGKTK